MSKILKMYLAGQCPYCQRVEIAALERGHKYERILIDLNNMPDWYKKLNPSETVPTLQLGDGKLIYESNLVARYLDQSATPAGTLLCSTPYENHRIEFFNSQIGDLISACYDLLRNPRSKQKYQELHDNAAYIDNIVAENQVTGGPYFCDNEFTMAEVMLVPFLIRFRPVLAYYTGCDIFEKAPHLKRMWAAATKRPAVKQSTLTPNEYIRFYAKFLPADAEIRKANGGPVLYGYKVCPFVDRANLAAKARKYEHTYIEVDISDTPDWYKLVNPRETVPTLITENGEIIHESQLVVNYIDSVAKEGNALLPRGTPEQDYDLGYFTSMVGNFVEGFIPFMRNTENREHIVWAAGQLSTLLEKKPFGPGPFFGGAHLNAGDIALLPFLARVFFMTPEILNGFDLLKEFPLLETLVTAALKAPEVQGVFRSKEEYLEVARKYQR